MPSTFSGNCSRCGIYFSGFRDLKQKNHFCSEPCQHQHHKGSFKEEAGTWTDTEGYVWTRVAGKNFFQHRFIMQNKVGRPLKKTEVVHHIDGNKSNNNLNNLLLLRNSSAHDRIHKFAKRHRLPIESLKFNQPWLA